jgi:hypothetical protein
VVLLPLISPEKVLYSLNILRRYKEENQNGNLELLRMLRKHKREISQRSFQSREQVTLDQWFIGAKGGN